jgi:putative transposase
MPRRPRVSMPNIAHPIIQRGNNRSACFYSESDYHFYTDCLFEYAELSLCHVHA